MGLRLGAALFPFWETREHLTEGRDAISRVLAIEGTAGRPKLRARILFAGAVLAGEQGDYVSARQLLEESLAICLELNDNRGVAVALNALAVSARDRGELAAASSLFERCVAIWKDLGDSLTSPARSATLPMLQKCRVNMPAHPRSMTSA